MSDVINLMLAVRERSVLFYHRDTNEFDFLPFSANEMKHLDPNAQIPYHDENNIRFLSYKEIDHKEIMRFYAKECVEDPSVRKQLFNILRRLDYIDAYMEKLQELDLYDDFVDACGEIYMQMFKEWAERNKLKF